MRSKDETDFGLVDMFASPMSMTGSTMSTIKGQDRFDSWIREETRAIYTAIRGLALLCITA